ncbi:alpha/beta hydrolase [Clostridium perfringens]|nr:alpha/beta hydrolase [Clostridium perfringens]
MAYFNYNGLNCYYEEIGEGKPLLMLHGNTASSRMFSLIVEKYSSDYKVILLDFLGHGKSDRLDKFPIDFWYNQGEQVIEFLRQKDYRNVYIIGSSGGALAAINVALEAPELVEKLITDSFEGEVPLKAYTENIVKDRELSKKDENARGFYEYMNGDDWESIVDEDTRVTLEHEKKIGKFFHKPLNELKAKILMTGSKEDNILSLNNQDFFEETYKELINKIGHGEYYIFEKGGHPAMFSNYEKFIEISKEFFYNNKSN